MKHQAFGRACVSLLLAIVAGTFLVACSNSDEGVRSVGLPSKQTASLELSCVGNFTQGGVIPASAQCTGPTQTCTIAQGQSAQCTAICRYTGLDGDGNTQLGPPQPCDDPFVEFRGPDNNILINQGGLQIAGGAVGGPVTITASDRGVSGSTNITVVEAQVENFEVRPVDETVPSGQTVFYRAIGTFTNGTQGAIATCIDWSVTNNPNTVVTIGAATGIANTPVDPDDIEAANLPQTETINADANLGTASCNQLFAISTNTHDDTTLTVVDPTLVRICVDPSERAPTFNSATGCLEMAGLNSGLSECTLTPVPQIQVGGEQRFIARAVYTNGYTCDITTKKRGGADETSVPDDLQTHWDSDDTGIATVNDDASVNTDDLGLATGVAVGTTDITAECCNVKGRHPLEVIAGTPPTSPSTLNVGLPRPDGSIDKFICVGQLDLVNGIEDTNTLRAQENLRALATPPPPVSVAPNGDITNVGNDPAAAEVFWAAVPGMWNGTDGCIAAGAGFGVPDLGGNSPVDMANAVNPDYPDDPMRGQKGVASAAGTVRLGAACVTAQYRLNGQVIDTDGATVLVLPATNDDLLSGSDGLVLCEALEPLLLAGASNGDAGDGALVQLLSGLGQALSPVLEGTDAVPVEDILTQVISGLDPADPATVPLTQGLDCVLDALFGQDPAAIADCGP